MNWFYEPKNTTISIEIFCVKNGIIVLRTAESFLFHTISMRIFVLSFIDVQKLTYPCSIFYERLIFCSFVHCPLLVINSWFFAAVDVCTKNFQRKVFIRCQCYIYVCDPLFFSSNAAGFNSQWIYWSTLWATSTAWACISGAKNWFGYHWRFLPVRLNSNKNYYVGTVTSRQLKLPFSEIEMCYTGPWINLSYPKKNGFA